MRLAVYPLDRDGYVRPRDSPYAAFFLYPSGDDFALERIASSASHDVQDVLFKIA